MTKCSFTNGSCQDTEEGGRACSLMSVCLCNAPQPKTTPVVSTSRPWRQLSRKVHTALGQSVYEAQFTWELRKKTAWGSFTHTHQHAPLPTVHSCSAEIFSSRFKMGEKMLRLWLNDMFVNAWLQTHTIVSLCLFSLAALLAGGGNCGEDQ